MINHRVVTVRSSWSTTGFWLLKLDQVDQPPVFWFLTMNRVKLLYPSIQRIHVQTLILRFLISEYFMYTALHMSCTHFMNTLHKLCTHYTLYVHTIYFMYTLHTLCTHYTRYVHPHYTLYIPTAHFMYTLHTLCTHYNFRYILKMMYTLYTI